MARDDLLALSDEDLSALTNRGTLKRAHKEVSALKAEIEESDNGDLTVRWSDGPICCIPAGATLDQGTCTCPANTLCRHLVRSVIVYRQFSSAESSTPKVTQSWDPGLISDESLGRWFRKAALTRARSAFEHGFAAELIRSKKPTARLYQHACTVRFLVPGDPRYTYCDCDEEAPCSHVPLAVWAFRLLEDEKTSGVVDTAASPPEVPEALLDDVERVLIDMGQLGISGADQNLSRSLTRLRDRLEHEQLQWLASVLSDVLEEHARYHANDALFSGERLAQRVGELLIRIDATRSDACDVPSFFVRGGALATETRARSGRYLGLGTAVEQAKVGPIFTTYLVDVDSGNVVTVERRFQDQQNTEPKSFWELGQTISGIGITIHAFGAGQLLSKGGKRSQTHRLNLGRTRAVVNPQRFEWEQLRAPVAAEGFQEAAEHLRSLPPAALRPRVGVEDLFVVPINAVEDAHFSGVEQAVIAELVDSNGGRARLHYPFFSRGAEGTDALLEGLRSSVCFIAGTLQLYQGQLRILPLSIIIEDSDRRQMIQPALDRAARSSGVSGRVLDVAQLQDPVGDFVRELQRVVADLGIEGVERVDEASLVQLRGLAERGEELGSRVLSSSLGELLESLEKKRSSLDWKWKRAAEKLLCLAAHVELARGMVR
ncbi:MAG: hypothetical protein AAFZ38_08625 [Myxococcota bacterium]